MSADVTGDFAATCGMADMNRVLQVECLDQRCEIISISVQVIAIPRLTRSTMAAAIVRDAAVAARSR